MSLRACRWKFIATLNAEHVHFKETLQLKNSLQIFRANQINSFAGKSKESIFITFSFNHVHDHKPKDCTIAPHQATLDKYQFTDLQQEEMRKEAADEARKHRHGNETHHHNEAEEDDGHYHDGMENVVIPEDEAEEHL